jgi:hypothetical protein
MELRPHIVDLADEIEILRGSNVEAARFDDALWRIERRARAAEELGRREFTRLLASYQRS